eukprot:TRINITY_DN4042_c0_g1_i13.p2 TRINITY_DN4042_c0_g1~~TRINITY_DN4042_c0_g1_i13.p2  ORF type:complete len:130 (-),score=42.50 TRINITY_DN4042_c0_g1_i13:369-734(-)
MIRRPPRSTHCISSAASDVYKRQILVYDITRKKSLDDIKTLWLHEIKKNPNHNVIITLLPFLMIEGTCSAHKVVGNKCDLEDKREVSIEDARDFAAENGNVDNIAARAGFCGDKRQERAEC